MLLLFMTLTSILTMTSRLRTAATEWDRTGELISIYILSMGEKRGSLHTPCREVTVIRLVGRGTIEEEMLQCAQMKLRLEKDITNSGI